MTLTVRLSEQLEKALEAYTAYKGLTKSHVVQEALAQYLVRTEGADTPVRKKANATSAAFEKAGLIGRFTGMNGESATKEVVRKRVLESVKGRR
jgi:hypothetical protein